MRPYLVLLIGILLLAACDVGGDGRATPTVRPTETLNETQIADLWTDTPTATFTDTATSTPTVTPSITSTPTDTPSITSTFTVTPSVTDTLTGTSTSTATDTPTATFTATDTDTPEPTSTHTPTDEPTATDTNTPRPTLTDTITPSATSTRTATATETPVPPTATASRTSTPRIVTPVNTATPLPSSTPRPTSTRLPSSTPRRVTSTAAATVIVTDIPLPPQRPTATVVGFPTPTFLPIPVSSTPFGNTGADGPFSGGPVPEASEIILRDADGNIQRANGEQLATGRVFDVGPQGQLAFQAFDNNLYVGGTLLTISPASEFGLKGRVDYIDYAPSGGRVAFTYRNPEAEVDNGVWVFNMSANTSQQIFRDTDRRADTVLFSPDSSVVLIRIVNGAGQPAGLTFLPVTWEANTEYRYHPYPYSTWSPNGTSVIVSGPIDGAGPSVLGRVNLDAEQTFIQYDFSSAGVSYTAAATELSNGQLAFLGGPGAAGPHRLFIMPIGGQAQVVSGEVPGTIESWEWNRARNAILMITNNGGTRQVWIVQTNGATRNITPTVGAPRSIRW